MDQVLVRDLFLVLTNESEFYFQYHLPLIKRGEALFKKGEFNRDIWTNAIQVRIQTYLRSEKRSSYYGITVSKENRMAVANEMAEHLLREMKIGNFTV